MHVVLWVLQVLLAIMFLFHGRMMWSPPATVRRGMEYVNDLPPNLRRFIGVAEILAGIGPILPALLNVLPALTPLAAAGIAVVMAGAAIYHIPRREYPNVGFNLVLLALSAFVAYGRWFIEPL
jgi:uncharacterized membrane protein YphA (DoxX/SURF4 family)